MDNIIYWLIHSFVQNVKNIAAINKSCTLNDWLITCLLDTLHNLVPCISVFLSCGFLSSKTVHYYIFSLCKLLWFIIILMPLKEAIIKNPTYMDLDVYCVSRLRRTITAKYNYLQIIHSDVYIRLPFWWYASAPLKNK